MNLKLAWGIWGACVGVLPGLAVAMEPSESPEILSLAEFSQPSTSVADWVAQAASDPARITGVTLDPTDMGLDIVLTTAGGQLLTIDATRFRAEGNQLLAELPNAVLALPDGAMFQSANPTADIAEIRLVQRETGGVQVIVTGAAGLPRREVALVADGLAYTLNPGAIEPAEELVVTGDRAPGYNVPSASVGSRTNTDNLDLPFSVQVVPAELLRDRHVQSVNEALRTVAGVTPDNPSYSPFEGFTIRGFTGRNIIRNGLRDDTNITSRIALSNIDRIEVLKGPAGALFSQGGPGGTVNIVTKQPLAEPRYTITGVVGNFDTYEGAIDFTGPLNRDRTLRYRLTAGASTTDTFIDFFDRQTYSIAPVLSWQISDRTKLTLEGEYTVGEQPNARGLPAKGTILDNINGDLPRSLFIGEPDEDLDSNNRYALRLGYNLEHRFSPNWQLRNSFQTTRLRVPQNSLFPAALGEDERTLERGLFSTDDQSQDNYLLDTHVVGNFKTGSIAHELLFGVELNRDVYGASSKQYALSSIDLFNPVYGQPRGELIAEFPREPITTDSLGIYLQDRVELTPKLQMLLGGRFDIVSQTIDRAEGENSFQQNEAFSPRIGLVYQPTENLSLYGSYSRSFLQVVGTGLDSTLFEPERGSQYEIGIKADWFDRKLSTTLAWYHITRSNVLTADPVDPNFSIQTGEQRSQGVEFNVVGEILPGWKIAGGYAYTDAEITEDNTLDVGNRINNVPKHAASLWTSYEIQEGSLKGLGLGLGLFHVGDRAGDLANSFEVPSYTRTDLSLFYNRENFRAAINIENLFDIDYFEAAESDLRVYYGAPFTIKGSLSFSF
jgi:iron complex outermembrane receptor protein